MTPTERIQRLRADLEADLGVTDRELRHAIVVGTLAAPLVIGGFIAWCVLVIAWFG